MSEVCPTTITAISYGSFLITNFIIIFLTPYLIQSENNYRWFALGVGLISLSCTLFGSLYLVESQGLEKTDIYKLLRKERTREELLHDKQSDLKRIKTKLLSSSDNDIEISNKDDCDDDKEAHIVEKPKLGKNFLISIS